MPWKKEDREGQSTPLKYLLDIHTSRSGYTDYNSGKTALLILEGEREWVEGENAGKREEAHEWLSIGKNFKPSADGKRIEHLKGDTDARMEPNCKAQRFLMSAMKAGMPLEELGEDSLDATMYAGHRVLIEVEQKAGKIDGEDKTFRQPLVAKYLGPLGGDSAPAAGNGVSDADIAALAKEMKASGNDHMDFIERAHKEFGLPLDAPVLAETGVWSNA